MWEYQYGLYIYYDKVLSSYGCMNIKNSRIRGILKVQILFSYCACTELSVIRD